MQQYLFHVFNMSDDLVTEEAYLTEMSYKQVWKQSFQGIILWQKWQICWQIL